MTNRWGRLKVSRRWAIVLLGIAFVSLLAFVLVRKPAVRLEIVELKQELLKGYEVDTSDPVISYRRRDFELHWVATLELRNNSSEEIQYYGFFSNPTMPDYGCLHWTGSTWARDPGMSASSMATEDHYKRGGSGGTGLNFKPAGLPPGGSLRFRVEFYERGKPSFVALPFRTPRPKVTFYELLPRALLESLPWRKAWHQAKSEVILNGATEMPPRWTSKPDIDKYNNPVW